MGLGLHDDVAAKVHGSLLLSSHRSAKKGTGPTLTPRVRRIDQLIQPCHWYWAGCLPQQTLAKGPRGRCGGCGTAKANDRRPRKVCPRCLPTVGQRRQLRQAQGRNHQLPPLVAHARTTGGQGHWAGVRRRFKSLVRTGEAAAPDAVRYSLHRFRADRAWAAPQRAGGLAPTASDRLDRTRVEVSATSLRRCGGTAYGTHSSPGSRRRPCSTRGVFILARSSPMVVSLPCPV